MKRIRALEGLLLRFGFERVRLVAMFPASESLFFQVIEAFTPRQSRAKIVAKPYYYDYDSDFPKARIIPSPNQRRIDTVDTPAGRPQRGLASILKTADLDT